jgi:hypothetical protein
MAPPAGMPHPDRTALRKWFGDLEVVEAKKELRVQPNDNDIKESVANDPRNCVFSRACQRMWNSTVVVFFGTVAYVDLLDAAGKRRVERFNISLAGQRFIREFDAGSPITPGGFVLLPPAPSMTIKEKRKNFKKYAAKRRRAILKGKTTGAKTPGAKRPKRKPSGIRLSVFRNGTGMAQFPRAA